jgi:outer membrane protein
MFRTIALSLLAFTASRAETYVTTLREAVELALRQNPELVLARLDEQKAAQAVRLAKDPFYPRLVAGSGAAYSTGYPLTIDGSPPSILQARAIQTFFNRSKSYTVEETRENARTSAIDSQIRRDDVAFRTAVQYLDAERTTQVAEMARRQIEDFEQIRKIVAARVADGRDLEIENDRAALNLARARQRATALEYDRNYLERSLAVVLGYGPDDAVKISTSERRPPELPASEQAAVEQALANSRELRRLESVLAARGWAIKAQHAARLPQVDLVAQYSLLTRYNFSEDFFGRFNRNAGQLGVSVQFPVLSGTGAAAQAATAEIESDRLRQQIKSAQGRISLDARRSFEELRNVEAAVEVARLDLELARKTVTLLLAQTTEGRVPLRDLAAARTAEHEKWIAWYEAGSQRERAQLDVLRQTGSLLSALR